MLQYDVIMLQKIKNALSEDFQVEGWRGGEPTVSVTVLERYVQMYECVAAYLIFVIFGTILERYLQM